MVRARVERQAKAPSMLTRTPHNKLDPHESAYHPF